MSVLQKYTGGQPVFMNNAQVGESCTTKYTSGREIVIQSILVGSRYLWTMYWWAQLCDAKYTSGQWVYCRSILVGSCYLWTMHYFPLCGKGRELCAVKYYFPLCGKGQELCAVKYRWAASIYEQCTISRFAGKGNNCVIVVYCISTGGHSCVMQSILVGSCYLWTMHYFPLCFPHHKPHFTMLCDKQIPHHKPHFAMRKKKLEFGTALTTMRTMRVRISCI